MIGKYITEINITSPTGLQQIRNRLSMKVSNELLKQIEKYHES
jgi:glutathione synthase/RimK-type ligase-like ATP-grasp enzyme